MAVAVRRDAGFSLVEALVATTLIVSVTAAVLLVAGPSRGIFKSQPESYEAEQRLRAGVDTLTRDLMNAGAGAYSGNATGSLDRYFAPILPFRRGHDAAVDDGVEVFKSTAITIFYVPPTAAQAIVGLDMPNPSMPVVVEAESGCPRDPGTFLVDPLCGFKANATKAAVFDGTGAFDTFAVGIVDEATQSVGFEPAQVALSKAYLGSSSHHVTKIVEMSTHVYYLNGATHQLLHYDGFAGTSPVLDDVTGLDFEYFGEASAPAFLRPGIDQAVSYGPSPPKPDVVQQPPFAAGENCVWQLSGGIQVSRLVSLGSAAGLVRLAPSQLTDGPWCPDPVNARRYDADLFRIRTVRVTLRVQSGDRSVERTIRFDISPRNLNLNR